MCRFAAYLGPDTGLQAFLLDPPHSIYRQSWEPRELNYAKLNADGFGVGWFDGNSRPAAYTSALPIWNDHNLPALARSMHSTLWLAQVRSATHGNPVHVYNTQPFCDDRFLFMHNGFVRDFHNTVRPQLQGLLEPDISASIMGNTDSEYLFAWLRQIARDHPQAAAPQLLRILVERLADLAGSTVALLNLLLTDNRCICAIRHAQAHGCPSLYYTTGDDGFPGAQLVASEPFADNGSWMAIPEHHVLVMERSTPPLLQPL